MTLVAPQRGKRETSLFKTESLSSGQLCKRKAIKKTHSHSLRALSPVSKLCPSPVQRRLFGAPARDCLEVVHDPPSQTPLRSAKPDQKLQI